MNSIQDYTLTFWPAHSAGKSGQQTTKRIRAGTHISLTIQVEAKIKSQKEPVVGTIEGNHLKKRLYVIVREANNRPPKYFLADDDEAAKPLLREENHTDLSVLYGPDGFIDRK